MNPHEWTEPESSLTYRVEGQNLFYRSSPENRWSQGAANPSSRTLARQVLSLAEENAELRAALPENFLAGEKSGIQSERARLRPLLERMEAYLYALERYTPTKGGERQVILAALRAELEKEG